MTDDLGIRKGQAAAARPLLLKTTQPSESVGAYWVLDRIPTKQAFESEDQLQKILHDYPQLLPVRHFWDAQHELVSLGREVPVDVEGKTAGSIDNLYLSSDGRLVLVEAKLYKNPQARREVVTQTLDYANALAKMRSVDQLTACLRRAKDGPLNANDELDLYGLYTHAFGAGRSTEPEFRDRLTRTLHHGQFLLFIIGDGIRESVEGLASLVARHPTLLYELGLVAIEQYAYPGQDGAVLIVPRLVTEARIVRRHTMEVRRDLATGSLDVSVELVEQTAEESEPLPNFEAFIEFLRSSKSTDRAIAVARQLHAYVNGRLHLQSSFTTQKWRVQYADHLIWFCSRGHGGSVEVNDALSGLRDFVGDPAVTHFVLSLADLSDRVTVTDNCRLSGSIAFTELEGRIDDFTNIVDRFVAQLSN